MTITPIMGGFLGGLVLGLATFFALGSVLANLVRGGASLDAPVVRSLDLVRKADLLILPLIGAALGYFGILDGVFGS